MSVSYGQSPSGKPTSVPVQSLRTCSCFLCPANMCTGRMTNDHLPNLLSFLFVPFPPQRCDTISPWPHLLSATSRQVGAKLLAPTSCQLGGKLACVHLIIPDNLSGISVDGLPMKNVRQLGAHFYLCPGQIIRAIMAHISNFGSGWSEVPGKKNVDQLGPHLTTAHHWRKS